MATVIQNPLKALGDQFYQEAIEHCRSYNARLCAERSVRLPFLDSQTGVAQNNCYIWMERRHRGPGLTSGQMYTYPARCWRKKRRLQPPGDPQLHLCEFKLEADLLERKDGSASEGTALEALLRSDGLEKKNISKDEESLLEIQKVLESEENGEGYHDDEDFELETPKRKYRGRGRGRGPGRRRADASTMDDQEKPYVCEICGKRYKNRPGLSYHYAHSHLEEEEEEPEEEWVSEPANSPHLADSDNHKSHKGPHGTIVSNNCCNFCLRDCASNRKMGHAEDLVPCPDCGRSAEHGHVGEERKMGAFGAEDLFGASSESDTSTFHGFDDDDFDEPLSNGSMESSRCR
ncbi:zinc finger protein DPF3 isoform X2 [Polypterus senegalus]|uniref:zinc finger protein DPF3 isoform X2 n=1 Tax=Polypterus senegalus TaxID=55291 RepID=UPI0019656634|nr:zinc finger protein DPF3 isoform X2 [Polypterus senegalus]